MILLCRNWVGEKLKELQLKVITAFVAGQDVFVVLSTAMEKKLMLCMPTTTLRSSLSVGRLTKINSDCCNAINSYHGRPDKSSLVSLFYAIKVATIKSAFVALGHLLNQSTDCSFYLEIWRYSALWNPL